MCSFHAGLLQLEVLEVLELCIMADSELSQHRCYASAVDIHMSEFEIIVHLDLIV